MHLEFNISASALKIKFLFISSSTFHAKKSFNFNDVFLRNFGINWLITFRCLASVADNVNVLMKTKIISAEYFLLKN